MTNAELQTLLDLDRSRLPEDGGPEFNRLIFSRSPYLLQHSRNPVSWREWGAEAQQEAMQRNLPLFVSIGYATCHWCHVMAHESFEDEDVADILNHAFIPVKVDREERPDLDEFCMAACQALTGSGGWPLNCFLKPDGTPFYALTYLPREPRRGMPGFRELLENIATVWQQKPDAVERNARSLMDALRSTPEPASSESPPAPAPLGVQALNTLRRIYDRSYHGFGTAPKFPMPPYLLFLLQQPAPEDRQLALDSLRAMRQGGIWDQLCGGIHRYSTDRHWLVHHFEKMLYDQALVAYASLEAYAVTADPCYRDMADNLIRFVLQELAAPEGGFYCGLDADADGHEGACHVWRKDEIRQLLGKDAEVFCDWYGVTGTGNFEGTDQHVLFQAHPDQPSPDRLDDMHHILQAARSRRSQPLRDVKILAGWNGLMIAALARGAVLTGNQEWLTAANRAADWIDQNLKSPNNRLLRSWCHGSPSSVPGFLDDYACMAWGYLELHRASGSPFHRMQAAHLCQEAVRLFMTPDTSLNMSGCDHAPLPIQIHESHDGVIPAGASVLISCLKMLANLQPEQEWSHHATQLAKLQLASAAHAPVNHLWLLRALSPIL